MTSEILSVVFALSIYAAICLACWKLWKRQVYSVAPVALLIDYDIVEVGGSIPPSSTISANKHQCKC